LRGAAFHAARTGDVAVLKALLADGRGDPAAVLSTDIRSGAVQNPQGLVVVERCLAAWRAWRRRQAWLRACAHCAAP
jgi:hypothetical protein